MTPTTPHPLQDWLRFSPWFFAAGFIFWFGSLTLFGINIDQGYALFREDQLIWLTQGRWAIFLFAQYIHPQPVLAYFPHLIFIVCTTLAYPLLLNAFQITIRYKIAALLAFPVLMAHPIWYFILEFTANTIPTGLGLLATLTAVWLFARLIHQQSTLASLVVNVLLQILLLSLALGLYQSLIFLAATFYLALLIKYYVQQPLRLKALFLSILILGGSLVFNACLLELLYYIYNTQDDYISHNLHLANILTSPKRVIDLTINMLFNVYQGKSRAYTISFISSGLIIISALLHLLLIQSRKAYQKIYKNNQNQRNLTLAVLLGLAFFIILIIFTPLIPQILTGGVYYMPYRTLIAVSGPLWLATIYLLINVNITPWRYVALALVLFSLVQISHTHARFTTGTALLKSYDRHLASAIYNRAVEIIPNFSIHEPATFDLSGGINYDSLYGSPSTALMTDSFFGEKYDTPIRVGNFFRSQGLRGLEPVNLHQHAELKPLYADMPSWPAAGAMRMHDGVLLIKLSD